jgi:3-methyladenine DNA glycosylase AlkD
VNALGADARVSEILAWLKRRGTKRNREGMARYGIVAKHVFGVSVADLRTLAKRHRPDHVLAAALWETGWYEARMLAAFVDDPALVTPRQMDRWARDFENWAICDTVCFHLFDKTPHAWRRIDAWAKRRDEFVKRAAFALVASLALHDRRSGDETFARLLPLIERAAADDRNFVRKGVNWALRAVGHRSAALNRSATQLARRLAASPLSSARWIGRDALRELTSPAVQQRIARRAASSGASPVRASRTKPVARRPNSRRMSDDG